MYLLIFYFSLQMFLLVLEILFGALLQESALVDASFVSFALPQAAELHHSAASPLPTKHFGFAGAPFKAWASLTVYSPNAYLFWKFFSVRFSRKAPMPSFLSSVPQVTPKASASKAEPVWMSVCMPMRMHFLDSQTAI